jgi:hypothetical protein
MQVILKLIQSPIPDPAILLDPIAYLCELIQTSFAVLFTTLAVHDHQSSLSQNLDMLGYGLAGDAKIIGYAIQGEALMHQQAQNGSSIRIGNSLKNVSSHIHPICNHLVAYLFYILGHSHCFVKMKKRVLSSAITRYITHCG